MLQFKISKVFWRFCDFYIQQSINDLLKNILKELFSLFLPVDSSTHEDFRKTEMTGVGERRNLFKVVFWMFMAIIISLALAQLK